jgi:transcriptional regulator with XRE-family HTH domain
MAEPISLPKETLTARQVRAGRALLAWSQQDLAKAANVGQSTVADFERGSRTPVPNNAEAIRSALEEAGVRFESGGAVMGPKLPPLGGRAGEGGFRLINATDLDQWADRRDAQGDIPELLAKLISASIGPGANVHFGAQESIQLSDWDGVTNSPVASGYVPAGVTGWEISTQRRNIGRKVQDDYDKRTADAGHLDRAQSTYIFVTPRNWAAKEQWAKERRAERKWRDVRVYDATDLVQWIAQHPSIGLWLAVSMGKRPQGAHQLEEVWSEWSLATQWPLSQELILSDRDDEAVKVLSWLRGDPSVFALKAETAEEAAAFVYAAIMMLPDDAARHYESRAVVAVEADVARQLGDGADPLIIILLDPDAGLAKRMALRGHYVLLAYGDGEHAPGDETTLPRPSRTGISSALEDMGIPRDRAEALARDAARSLAVLRRLIPAAPGRLPKWAQSPPPKALLAAMLAGGWTERKEGDRRVLERLSGMSYAELEAALMPYTASLDSPLRKVGEAWKVASPRDAWFLFAKYLSGADIAAFQEVVSGVLGAADPRFNLAPDKRWSAEFDGIRPEFSGWLRNGVGETLILISLFGDRTLAARDGSRLAAGIVRSLLKDATQQRWWSLSSDFTLLAEASPTVFLDMIDESLNAPDRPIDALFGVDEDPLMSREHVADLLWALEKLAWSPLHLGRVSELLARLAAIDPKRSNFTNRPENSLRHLFLLWSPQTFATYDERLKVLDRLRDRYPNEAWTLLLKILPKGHDFSSPTSQPRWLDFSEWQRERVTYQMMHKGALDVSERVIEDAGDDIARWTVLVDRLPDFAPTSEKAIAKLAEVAARASNDPGAEELRKELRDLLHRHRAYPDAEWAMKEGDLQKLEAIYESLAPSDVISRNSWLFRNDARLPSPEARGWRAEEAELLELRKRAALEIFRSGGFDALFALAAGTSSPGFIGVALHQDEVSTTEQTEIIKRSLLRESSKERDIAYGMMSVTFRDEGEAWAEKLLARAKSENWGEEAIGIMLRAFPQKRWTWERAAEIGPSIERAYWEKLPILWVEGEAVDIEFAARKLIEVGRAHHAIHFLGHHLEKGISSELLVEVMKRAIGDAKDDDADGNEASMFRYHVAEILKVLDKRGDVTDDTLFQLEWSYLRVLEYSGREPIVLKRSLAERPEVFIDLVKIVYKPSEESGVVDEEADDPAHREAIASQAYELLRQWDRVPGSDDDGQVDHTKLSAWIRRARILAAEVGREDIADHKIGNVLSASADDPDGSWPQRAVRDVIEDVRSEELESGFIIGHFNRRGVTTRGMRDGGAQERALAAKHRGYAAATALEWPRTSAMLEKIAKDYDADAQREDERAERVDWR